MSWRTSAILLLALSAGCDNAGLPLEGRQFLLSSAEGYTPVSGTTIRVSFEDGRVGISGGCNGMGGEYTVREQTLVVDGLESTLRACGADLSAQDEFLGSLITSNPKIALEQNELTLTGGNATLVFLDREVADPDRPLVGTVWTIDTLIMNELAVSPFRSEEPVTLSFAADNSFTIRGPCNTLAGKYAAGTRLTLSEIGITQAACTSGATVETHLIAVFAEGAKLSYEIEADKLRLVNGDKGVMADAP